MKSGKTKIRDSVANIGNLKEQLSCVLKEVCNYLIVNWLHLGSYHLSQMHAYTTKIEDVKTHSKEEDLGYKRFADLDSRYAFPIVFKV